MHHFSKLILFSFTVLTLACGGDDDSNKDSSTNNGDVDQVDMQADSGDVADDGNTSPDDAGHGDGKDELTSFCCAGEDYYECPGENASLTCSDTSNCVANASKNRVCGGNSSSQPIGATCSDSFECKGGACRIRQEGSYCTVTCNGDQDCPLNWTCYGSNNKICIKPGE